MRSPLISIDIDLGAIPPRRPTAVFPAACCGLRLPADDKART